MLKYKKKYLNNIITLIITSIITIKKSKVTFNPHLFNREAKRCLSLEKIEESIKTGNINSKKIKFPKLYITKYFRKENITYHIIIIKHKNFVEVITAWKKKGR
ncbi:hypothetical protein J4216_04290 [Candidatus Woesearchaeota archaeon]|nr:hypothetical protein [Candidatus Woesearchaeota archaeon]